MDLKDPKAQEKSTIAEKATPVFDLKPLPDHLRYAFLGGNEIYAVIVSAFLKVHELEELLGVQRKHKSAIGWSISDIKKD